jgi:hypothetical protein
MGTDPPELSQLQKKPVASIGSSGCQVVVVFEDSTRGAADQG